MTEYTRTHVDTLVNRFRETPRTIIAVLGPRQSGKTTAVLQALKKSDLPSLYCSPDRPEVPESSNINLDPSWLIYHWEQARRAAEDWEGNYILVLDEIQKIPQWSTIVKGLWDQDRMKEISLHVVILGSTPWKMQYGLTESLAGRFEVVQLTHWSYAEMVDAFGYSMEQYLYYGGYPGAVQHLNDPSRWSDYIRSSIIAPGIESDIFSLMRVDKPVLLKNLFELGTSYSGQILSYNKMLGQLEDAGNTTTLSRYLHLLEETGFLIGLEKYSSTRIIGKKSSPKWLAPNTALISANSLYSFGDLKAAREFKGRLVKSAVGAHLHNTATSRVRLYYWRDPPNEVDYVLQRGDQLIAIEVKTDRVRPARLKGLEEFSQRFRVARKLIVSESGVSLEEFLSQPADSWFE